MKKARNLNFKRPKLGARLTRLSGRIWWSKHQINTGNTWISYNSKPNKKSINYVLTLRSKKVNYSNKLSNYPMRIKTCRLRLNSLNKSGSMWCLKESAKTLNWGPCTKSFTRWHKWSLVFSNSLFWAGQLPQDKCCNKATSTRNRPSLRCPNSQ